MPYKTWALNDVLTAADMNSHVRDQGVTICTSSTRPTGIVDGKSIYETDTDRLYVYDGSTWQPLDYGQSGLQVIYYGQIGGVTNTAWANKTNAPTVTLTVPNSGRVEINIKTVGWCDTPGQYAAMAVAMSGANSAAAAENFATKSVATTKGSQSVSYLQGGLSPGSTAFITQFRVSGGTGSFEDSCIWVKPSR